MAEPAESHEHHHHHHHHRPGSDEAPLRRQDSRTLSIQRQNSGEKFHWGWPKEYGNKAYVGSMSPYKVTVDNNELGYGKSVFNVRFKFISAWLAFKDSILTVS